MRRRVRTARLACRKSGSDCGGGARLEVVSTCFRSAFTRFVLVIAAGVLLARATCGALLVPCSGEERVERWLLSHPAVALCNNTRPAGSGRSHIDDAIVARTCVFGHAGERQ